MNYNFISGIRKFMYNTVMELFLIPVDNNFLAKEETLNNLNFYSSTCKKHNASSKSLPITACSSVYSETDGEEFPKLTDCLKSNWLYRLKIAKSVQLNKLIKMEIINVEYSRVY